MRCQLLSEGSRPLVPLWGRPQALVSSVKADAEAAENKAKRYKREMLKMEAVMDEVRTWMS